MAGPSFCQPAVSLDEQQQKNFPPASAVCGVHTGLISDRNNLYFPKLSFRLPGEGVFVQIIVKVFFSVGHSQYSLKNNIKKQMNKEQSCNITQVFLLLPLLLEYRHNVGNVTAKTSNTAISHHLQQVTNSNLICSLSWPLVLADFSQMYRYWQIAVHKC